MQRQRQLRHLLSPAPAGAGRLVATLICTSYPCSWPPLGWLLLVLVMLFPGLQSATFL